MKILKSKAKIMQEKCSKRVKEAKPFTLYCYPHHTVIIIIIATTTRGAEFEQESFSSANRQYFFEQWK